MTNTTQMWFRLLMTTVFSCFAFSTLSLPLQSIYDCVDVKHFRLRINVLGDTFEWNSYMIDHMSAISLIIISAIQEHNVWIRSTITKKWRRTRAPPDIVALETKLRNSVQIKNHFKLSKSNRKSNSFISHIIGDSCKSASRYLRRGGVRGVADTHHRPISFD